MTTKRYLIRGMDCAEETRALQKTVGSLDGVESLDFNLLNATMTVAFFPESIDEAAILEAVRRAGLEGVPIPEGADGEACTVCVVEETFWQKRGRVLFCAASGILLLLGFLSHAAIHGSVLDALTGGHGLEAHRFPLVSLVFYGLSIVAGAWFVFPRAVNAARRLRADMNLLMTIAVIGAVILGEWFEAAAVAFLFSFSLLLESWSVGRARRAIESLMDLSPTTARYLCPHDGDVLEKPVAQVPVGVTVLVRPGEKIPLDGVVTRGTTTVNEAPITGESMPVEKEEGDEVFAGTINGDGSIEFTSTRAAGDTTLSRIIRMVEEAQSRRAPSEQWVERFARYYTPAMILLAALIAVVPPLAFGGEWSRWFYEALVILVIACPCALVISTPVSIVAALASAARGGVLIKGGVHLETAGRLRAVALDKTGTLTFGRPEVQEILPLNDHTPRELLERAAALETHSSHPLARAILRHAQREGIEVPPAEDVQAVQGKGAEGLVYGRPFWLGSHRFLHEKAAEPEELHQQALSMEDAGHSIVAIGNDEHVCGLISVADSIRPEAAAALRALKDAGVERIVMLTGDNRGTAEAVAREAGVDEVRAELLPEDKLRIVEELVRAHPPAAMIGDGVNDAPALAAASLGIAMGAAGTDAAIETADIALMTDDLARVPWMIRHAQRTLSTIRWNIGFALAVKALFMGLTLAGRATLWMAIAADMGASLVVIFNSLRLLRTREPDAGA